MMSLDCGGMVIKISVRAGMLAWGCRCSTGELRVSSEKANGCMAGYETLLILWKNIYPPTNNSQKEEEGMHQENDSDLYDLNVEWIDVCPSIEVRPNR